VCVVEKNSAKTLDRCLTSIRRHVPCHNLIVSDGYSTDESLSIAKKYTDRVYVDSGFLGAARYRAAEASTTKWIAFVDSDVYLYKDWWPNMRMVIRNPHVGWVTALSDFPCLIPLYRKYWEYLCRMHGGTAFSNTLVRRDLILDCPALLQVHAGEDWVAKKHILDLGLEAPTLKKVLSYHDNDHFKSHLSGYYRWGRSYKLRYGAAQGLALGYLSFARYPFVDWFKYGRKEGFSLRLLFVIGLLGFCGLFGILNGKAWSTQSSSMGSWTAS
jgi:glycosyltransferase involved in cell wall biosynthesis